MSSPKEKAKELIDFYFKTIDAVVIDRYVALQEHEDTAKACALIAVEEILKHSPTLPHSFKMNDFDYDGELGDAESYWQQVKAEIEKL